MAAVLLPEHGFDVEHVRAIGRDGLTDEEQLDYAAAAGRVLVTRDYGDFPKLAERFYLEQRAHAGVLLMPRSLPNRDIAGIAAAIEQFDRERSEPLQPYETVWLRPRAR